MTRGNYRNEVGEFVVVENGLQRVVAAGVPGEALFGYVRLQECQKEKWEELIYWDSTEWHEASSEAFEAILGIIAKVAVGERIRKP